MNEFLKLTQSGQLFQTLDVLSWHGYRPGIPDEVVDVLVSAARRNGDAETLLDLGTGDGQVVRVLYPYFRDIIAADPVKELLDLAERGICGLLTAATKVRLVQAEAEQYSSPDGWTASLVTICRAFHWMDQPVVLDRLTRVVSASGVVAIFHDNGFWATDSPWKQAVRAMVHDFLGADRRPGLVPSPHYTQSFKAILAESAFSNVDEITIPIRRIWTGESILGLLYSSKFAARPLFGHRVEEFEGELRRALADLSVDDTFAEDDVFTIWLARRPV